MPKIVFSQAYFKFPNPAIELKEAILVAVCSTKLKDLPKEFIKYDTEYIDEQLDKIQRYELKDGKYLLLLFVTLEGNGIFTTLRSFTKQKELYYKNLISKKFKVIIHEKKE